MSVALKHWPFQKDEEVTVYWITSPTVSTTKECKVFFRTGTQTPPKLVEVPSAWGTVPMIWIGQRWRNGRPLDNQPVLGNEITIPVKQIKNDTIEDAGKAIPRGLYPLNALSAICGEKVLVFTFHNIRYIVPCVEVTRVVYMHNSVLANQFISPGGLEELINLSSWENDHGTVRFDFSEAAGKNLTKSFAESFAILYSVNALRNGWAQSYIDYQNSGERKKIITHIPSVPNTNITLRFIESGNTRLVTYISRLVMNDIPFSEVEYGPETVTHAQLGRAGTGMTPDVSASDEVLLGESDQSAQIGKNAVAEAMGSSLTTGRKLVVTRKKHQDDKPTRSRRVSGSTGSALYSVNDQIGNGDLPQVNVEVSSEEDSAAEETKIEPESGFEPFCQALGMLNKRWRGSISAKSPSYENVPGGKAFSKLASTNQQRRYAFAEVSTRDRRWIVIELDLRDGRSLSTLFVLAKEEENGAMLAKKMVQGLVDHGGNWGKFLQAREHRLLDHRKERKVSRWSELMAEKVTSREIGRN